MDKLGKMSTFGIFLIVVGILAAAQIFGIYDVTGTLSGWFAPAVPPVEEPERCITTDKVTVTWDMIDTHNPGQTVDDGTDDEVYWMFHDDVTSGLLPGTAAGDGDDDAGTETFAPGDLITVYWGFDPTGTVASNSYYTAVSEEVIPCKGAVTLTHYLINASSGADGLTMKLFSEDDALLLTDQITNTEDIDDGATDCLDGSIKMPSEAGMPHGGCLVADFADNSTALNDVTMKFDGVTAESCAIPDAHSNTYYTTYLCTAATNNICLDAATRTSKGFKLPPMLDGQTITWEVCFEDDTTGTFAATAFNATLWDYDYVWSDDDNAVVLGPEDPDNDGDVGQDNDGAPLHWLGTGFHFATS